jgi:hypothetical protein
MTLISSPPETFMCVCVFCLHSFLFIRTHLCFCAIMCVVHLSSCELFGLQ